MYNYGTLYEAWQGATGPRPTDQVWQEEIIVIMMIIFLVIFTIFMVIRRGNNHYVHYHPFHDCHCPQIINDDHDNHGGNDDDHEDGGGNNDDHDNHGGNDDEGSELSRASEQLFQMAALVLLPHWRCFMFPR